MRASRYSSSTIECSTRWRRAAKQQKTPPPRIFRPVPGPLRAGQRTCANGSLHPRGGIACASTTQSKRSRGYKVAADEFLRTRIEALMRAGAVRRKVAAAQLEE